MIIAIILGLIIGFLTGLLPGLHSNTVISILASLDLDPKFLSILIVCLFPVHLIVSFIPAIFLSIPEESNLISVLPGQKLVLDGEGIKAIKIVSLSAIVSAILSFLFFEPAKNFLPEIYGAMNDHLLWILVIVSAILILKSKKTKLALVIFVLSGIIGKYTLGMEMHDPFLAMFGGMFAISHLLNYNSRDIPEQKETKINNTRFIIYSVLGVVMGFGADLLPGVSSPSQVATFAAIFIPFNTSYYLSILSSISVSEAIFSFATVSEINKSRAGEIEWLSEFISIENNIILLLSLFLFSLSIAILAIYLLRKKIGGMANIDFTQINILLIMYLVIITFILNDYTGLLILMISTVLGYTTIRLEIERINLMGAIIVPTILILL